jgi:oligopeptide/dipeptide ABC transporter ATP-binding protein
VICDEPTSALDVSVQAQIFNLLLELQRERGIGLLFISHDLHVVRRMSDEVVVMYAGAVMERGPGEAVAAHPRHPYTRALLDAMPASTPSERHLAKRTRTTEGIASAATTGCPFSTRCPKVQEICRVERPPSRASLRPSPATSPSRERVRPAPRVRLRPCLARTRVAADAGTS